MPFYIHGGSRCGLRASEHIDDWYVGTSPRNGDNASVEGPWEDWVKLATGILAEENRRRGSADAAPANVADCAREVHAPLAMRDGNEWRIVCGPCGRILGSFPAFNATPAPAEAARGS